MKRATHASHPDKDSGSQRCEAQGADCESLSSCCGIAVLFAFVVCFGHLPLVVAQQIADDTRPAQWPHALFPIAETRRGAIAAASFHRDLDAATIRKWMELSSRCTMAEFELFLAPLSPAETQLLKRMESTPAPIVNRLHFEHLRSVLKNRGLLSLKLEDEAAHSQIGHTTPGVENQLFGAFDCVFASVGPSARFAPIRRRDHSTQGFRARERLGDAV